MPLRNPLRLPIRSPTPIARGLAGLFAGALVWAALALPATAQNVEYSALFEGLKPGLFTVEVVDRVSNNKNAIGSAFAVDGAGRLATNYHVVSEYLLDPERYALRYRDVVGETGPLELLDVDVLHDLALVRIDDPAVRPAAVFELATSAPADGSTLRTCGAVVSSCSPGPVGSSSSLQPAIRPRLSSRTINSSGMRWRSIGNLLLA